LCTVPQRGRRSCSRVLTLVGCGVWCWVRNPGPGVCSAKAQPPALTLRNVRRDPRAGAMAHACNPSYSGGRDQEDHGSKPAPGKWFERPCCLPLEPQDSAAPWGVEGPSPHMGSPSRSHSVTGQENNLEICVWPRPDLCGGTSGTKVPGPPGRCGQTSKYSKVSLHGTTPAPSSGATRRPPHSGLRLPKTLGALPSRFLTPTPSDVWRCKCPPPNHPEFTQQTDCTSVAVVVGRVSQR
jgi:hypothetical protein